MNISQEKIIELLGRAKSCAVMLDHNPREEHFLLKNALKIALNELGIASRNFPSDGEILKYYCDKWSSFLNDSGEEEISKSIIKIPKKDILIKELSYNENEDFFSLVITPKSGKLIKESLILEESLPEPDVFFCFFDDIHKLEYFKSKVVIPENSENIILITENNLVSSEKQKSLTEKITDLLQLLNLNFSPAVINLLFASLIVETNKFKYYLNKDVFSLANFLISRGAESDEIINVLENQKTDSFVQILGRAAARTHYDEKLNVMWTFLQEADFEKTGNTPSLNLILKLIKDLENIVKSAKSYAFFWQKDTEIWIALKSLEKEYLTKIARIMELEFKSDYLIIGPFQNFSEAEMKIRETLNKIAYNLEKDSYFDPAL